ncbi:class II glutamine amidotransferase [Candidatus Thorarchaeota archaeon]|nr:MAG: class II glutamine amidotransferase [Candidatus Thorarchaeota archaeon]
MCDLLGLTFTTNITANISLNLFQEHGMKNPDGWGLAFYNEGVLQVIKEAKTAIDSGLYDFMERYTSSKTIISHVRRSTRGIPSYLNTHPFYRRLVLNDRKLEIAFAHNGTITDVDCLSSGKFAPIGETDSEIAFCHILNNISSQKDFKWDIKGFRFLMTNLREINDGQNTMNCIFSDGNHLFCYSDENDHNNGLRFTKQEFPFGKVELERAETSLGFIDISGSDSKRSNRHIPSGYIISTRILTKETWIEFERGELIVFKDGRIIFPANRVKSD